MDLVGYKHLKGKSKKTGEPYDLYMLCTTEISRDEKFQGVETEKSFVSSDRINCELKVGMDIDILYDKNGYVKDVIDLSVPFK